MTTVGHARVHTAVTAVSGVHCFSSCTIQQHIAVWRRWISYSCWYRAKGSKDADRATRERWREDDIATSSGQRSTAVTWRWWAADDRRWAYDRAAAAATAAGQGAVHGTVWLLHLLLDIRVGRRADAARRHTRSARRPLSGGRRQQRHYRHVLALRVLRRPATCTTTTTSSSSSSSASATPAHAHSPSHVTESSSTYDTCTSTPALAVPTSQFVSVVTRRSNNSALLTWACAMCPAVCRSVNIDKLIFHWTISRVASSCGRGCHEDAIPYEENCFRGI